MRLARARRVAIRVGVALARAQLHARGSKYKSSVLGTGNNNEREQEEEREHNNEYRISKSIARMHTQHSYILDDIALVTRRRKELARVMHGEVRNPREECVLTSQTCQRTRVGAVVSSSTMRDLQPVHVLHRKYIHTYTSCHHAHTRYPVFSAQAGGTRVSVASRAAGTSNIL